MSSSFLLCSELESKAVWHADLSKSEVTDKNTVFSYSYEKEKNSEVPSLKHLFFFFLSYIYGELSDPTKAWPCDISVLFVQRLCISSELYHSAFIHLFSGLKIDHFT